MSEVDPLAAPPFICHVFPKIDNISAATLAIRDQGVKSLHKSGVVQNYLFVSSKTNHGIDDLKSAIFDSQVKNGVAREVRPKVKDASEDMKKRVQLLEGSSIHESKIEIDRSGGSAAFGGVNASRRATFMPKARGGLDFQFGVVSAPKNKESSPRTVEVEDQDDSNPFGHLDKRSNQGSLKASI